MIYNDSGHACIGELSHAKEMVIDQFKDDLDPSIFLVHSANELCAIWKQHLAKDYKFVAKQKNQSGQHGPFVNFCANQGIGKVIVFTCTFSYRSNQALLSLSKVYLVVQYFVQARAPRRKLLVVRLRARLLLLTVRKAKRRF